VMALALLLLAHLAHLYLITVPYFRGITE
jgi:hypothetical protein